MSEGPGTITDEFASALRDLDRALDENVERTQRMKERIRMLLEAIDQGRSLGEFVPTEETPLLVQLLTTSADHLHEFGSRVRRTEARALYADGMTMEQIATVFGVSRQRVSALLREPDAGR